MEIGVEDSLKAHFEDGAMVNILPKPLHMGYPNIALYLTSFRTVSRVIITGLAMSWKPVCQQ